MDNQPKRKPINLDDLISKKLPDGMTFGEYKAAKAAPEHELWAPQNPRHESFMKAKEILEKSTETNWAAAQKSLEAHFAAPEQRIQEMMGPSYESFVKEMDEQSKKYLQPPEVTESLRAHQQNFADFDFKDSFLGRIETHQEQAAIDRKQRDERDEQRHRDVTDALLTMCVHMERQREELENLRGDQQAATIRQEIENQRNLAVGVGTLVIALLTLFATVVVAF